MKITQIVPASTLRRCAVVIAIACAAYFILASLHFEQLFRDDAGGIAALLQIIGTLYSVLYAFATYVIWGQFTAVETEILKEAGALKDIIVFSRSLKENVRDPVVRSIRNYVRAVTETEWRALSQGGSTEKTDRLFLQIISEVAGLKFEDDSERPVYERLLEIANTASAHRDERLSLSLKRIPRTLLAFVMLTAIMILFLLFFYPFRSPLLGLISMAVTSMLLFFAHFVLTDLDNPFEGTWNLSPEPFNELLSKFR